MVSADPSMRYILYAAGRLTGINKQKKRKQQQNNNKTTTTTKEQQKATP